MTPAELYEYAVILVLEHARGVEFLSIHEMAAEHIGHDISDEDAKKVDALITKAQITVAFPDADL